MKKEGQLIQKCDICFEDHETEECAFNGESKPVRRAGGDSLERVVRWMRRWVPVLMAWVSGLHASLALVRWHKGDILWTMHAMGAALPLALCVLFIAYPPNDQALPQHPAQPERRNKL